MKKVIKTMLKVYLIHNCVALMLYGLATSCIELCRAKNDRTDAKHENREPKYKYQYIGVSIYERFKELWKLIYSRL